MELLNMEQRSNGLSAKTPLSLLPLDITPEWSAVREKLDAALTALLDFDGANNDLLAENWQQIAENKERAYVAAIQNGTKPPARPKGGYVADVEAKRPDVVGEWFRLVGVKDRADKAAWAVMVAVAPLAVPDAQAAIEATGEAFKAAEEALEKARDAFVFAFSHRCNLEQYAQGTDMLTGSVGLPLAVTETVSGTRLPASIVVPNALEWLDAKYGPADTSGRLPAMRKVRGKNGVVLEMPPHLALVMEGNENDNAIEYVDGLPPESRLKRGGAVRMEVTPNA
jgi:hypothetical protein